MESSSEDFAMSGQPYDLGRFQADVLEEASETRGG